MDAELKQFEEELERLAPAGMPDGMIARMEAAMEGWQSREEPTEKVVPKVVPFPGPNAGEEPSRKGRFWAAAAAVAILGASAALLVPNGGPARRETAAVSESPDFLEASFEPMRAHRNIINASDQGVVMTADARPHRAVALECVDSFEFRNEAGARLRVEGLPKVRIWLIPVRTD